MLFCGLAGKAAVDLCPSLYLDELAAQSLTGQINQALRVAGDDGSRAAATAAGRRLLAAGDDDW